MKVWRKQLLDTICKSAPTKTKSSPTASSQGHLPSTYIWMNGKVLEEVGVGQFIYLRSAQTKAGASVFLQWLSSTNHLSCQYCSLDVRAVRWLRIWRDESKPFKTNAAGGCLAYHTKNTKQIYMTTVQCLHWRSGTFIVKRRKLSWFGLVCHHDTLPTRLFDDRTYFARSAFTHWCELSVS